MKRFLKKIYIIGILIVIAAVVGIACYLSPITATSKPVSKEQLAKAMVAFAARNGQPSQPLSVPLVPLKMSHSVRLAIGGLGLADDEKNRGLGDLVAAELTGVKGFELVERASLDRILQEQKLSWSGLVRANDAVRIGKLLKVEWFLLGTEAAIAGTNCLVARIVDARTGIILDAGVIPAETSLPLLASELAGFLRQVRQNAASAKLHTYLAIGAFEDVGVNNRLADFPSQLHAYLTAAYRDANVTLLERESVDILLREMDLDLAGLTDNGIPGPSPTMQSAFWVVSGQYQSYETTNVQVEVRLKTQRVFGTSWDTSVRGTPGEPIDRMVRQSIDDVVYKNNKALFPTRMSEARIQMDIGEELAQRWGNRDLVVIGSDWYGNTRSDPQTSAKQKRRLDEAIRAFETVLLLEPQNHQARMYLGACMRNMLNLHPDVACRYYREIIDDPAQDNWTEVAQKALIETFLWFGPEEKLRWLESAVSGTTNATAIAFYREQIEVANADVTIMQGNSPKAEEFARQRLIETIRSADGSIHHQLGSSWRSDLGLSDYVAATGGDANSARNLAKLLPTLVAVAPDLEPYLIAHAMGFQPDTNTPIRPLFQSMITNSLLHPRTDINPGQLWIDITQVYYWCYDKKDYSLAIQIMEARRQAAAAGYSDFGDEEKIMFAFAYLAVERWQDALNIFECYSNRPLVAGKYGPWGDAGRPLMTDKLTALCREKLGQTSRADIREFDIGKPVLSLGSHSIFLADANGLWVGSGGALLQLDFELKTNLVVKLPIDPSVPITALSQTASGIWIGTAGEGLICFDKTSRQCRRFAETDGLLMDYISALDLLEDSLWIGYSSGTGGGLSCMDIVTGKFRSFTPALDGQSVDSIELKPLRRSIGAIIARTNQEIWMLSGGIVQDFQSARGVCKPAGEKSPIEGRCIAADSSHLAIGEGGASVAVQDLGNRVCSRIQDLDAFPNPPTTVTLDGNQLWIGCEGAIAEVSLKQACARKFCRVKAIRVDRIQIAGGYLWALCDGLLYRAPLSALQ